MLSITYEIDPGGDVELVLNKPNCQKIVPVLHFAQDVPAPGVKSNGIVLDYPDFNNPPCTGRYSVFKELYPGDKKNVSPVDSEVRMKVSSRHLILASRTFKVMLEGPWSEGTSSPQSVRQINASDWDAMAFAIVLDIIHGRHRGILEDMTLGLVARIATIVDYYESHDAFYVYHNSWISDNVKVQAPTHKLCNATLLCLYAAWVFSDKSIVSHMAHLTLLHSKGLAQIDTNDLPIGSILDNIEDQRQRLITKTLQLLGNLQERLLEETSCPVEHENQCTVLTLGVLMRVRYKIARLKTPLEHPYDGYSLNSVLRMITDIEEPMALHLKNIKTRTSKWSKTSRPCSIVGRLTDSIESIQSEIWSFCMRDSLEKVIPEEPPTDESRCRINFGDTKLLDLYSTPATASSE